MKKMLFIALVVAFCVMATSAFAAGENGAVGTSTFYRLWNPTLGGNVDYVAAPHTGYAANTVKCAVCHAVHNASTNGQLLLQVAVADACTFCHITAPAAGTTGIYAGDPSKYTVDSHFNHASNDGAGTELTGGAVTCSDCHSVHGANTWDFSNTNGSLTGANLQNVAGKILKRTSAPTAAFGGQAIPAGYQTSGVNGAKTWDMAITTFCTQCHAAMFAQTSQDNQYATGPSGSDMSAYTGFTHPMIHENTLGDFGSAAEEALGKGIGNTILGAGQYVAWRESGSCRSCHGAGNTSEGGITSANSFPHYTSAAYFLLSADNAQPGTTVNNASFGDQDGVCLRCHRGWQSQGVGLSF